MVRFKFMEQGHTAERQAVSSAGQNPAALLYR